MQLSINRANLDNLTPKPITDRSILRPVISANSKLESAKNSILFSNNNNGFFSLDADSGLVNWKQKINSNVRPIFFNNFDLYY